MLYFNFIKFINLKRNDIPPRIVLVDIKRELNIIQLYNIIFKEIFRAVSFLYSLMQADTHVSLFCIDLMHMQHQFGGQTMKQTTYTGHGIRMPA